MAKHGKKYLKASELVDQKLSYDLTQAVELLKKTVTSKFDPSLEVHLRLGVDPTHADQMVRSTVALPHGTGKNVRVIAFVQEDKAKEAKEAGAIKAGMEELIEEIQKGFLDFDVAVATPDAMKSLSKVAKILGTKGLMPNPKAGTVTMDISKTIKEIKKGKVEYRTDKQAQIHQIFGKASFTEDQIKDNLKAFLKAIVDTKPATVKGTYIRNIGVATTMGPGIRLDVSKIMAELK
ncbi:MAG: 50S ribosomal protein L1 [Candidatus Gracilibacteria bacterium]|jgi:large subunit ribosomal protein L1